MYEPQSLYCNETSTTVHSGILVTKDGGKAHHPYKSGSKVHDQAFVYIAIRKMVATTDISFTNITMIESDNCTGQYKPSDHFHNL